MAHTIALLNRTPRVAPTRLNAGATLSAVDALTNRNQQRFNREQVAYLLALAYESGYTRRAAEDTAEIIGTWQERPTPRRTREQRIRARLAADERRAGPPRYFGGPVAWETGR